MLRLIAVLVLLGAGAAAQQRPGPPAPPTPPDLLMPPAPAAVARPDAPPDVILPDAPPLHPSPYYRPVGPAAAAGVLVWIPPPTNDEVTAAESPWLALAVARGYDVWRFDRLVRLDLRGRSNIELAAGLMALRAGGYRRVLVIGNGVGSSLAASAAARSGLADAVVALFPPESPSMRRDAWSARLGSAVAGTSMLVIVRGEGDAALVTTREAAARLDGWITVLDGLAAHPLAECVLGFLDHPETPPACTRL